MGEPFVVDARFSVIDACFESKNILDKAHDLVATPFGGVT